MKNKKLCIVIILLILISPLNINAANKAYKVAGDRNYPPYEYIDDDGIYRGFNIDIMNAVALATGIEITFVPMSWQEVYTSLEDNQADIIQGITITDKRKLEFAFTKPLIENTMSMFVLNENKTINSVDDLENKKVGVQYQDTGEEIIVNKNIQLYRYDTQEEALKGLISKEIDVIIGNTLTVSNIINREKLDNRVHVRGKEFSEEDYAMAVSKDNKQLQEVLNRGIEDIKKNGTYDMIYRKWFGNTVNTYKDAMKAISIIFLVSCMIFMYVYTIHNKMNEELKKQVEEKTLHQKELIERLKISNKKLLEEKDFREIILNNVFMEIVVVSLENDKIFTNNIQNNSKIIDENSIIKNRIIELVNKYDECSGQEWIDEKYIKYYITNLKIDNKIKYKIAMYIDNTSERQIEEDIRRRDKLEIMDKIIASIAHEIRNPLTAIKMYAELIPKKINDKEFQNTISIDIPTQIERIDSLINEFIEFTSPKLPTREIVNLVDEMNTVLRFVKNQIKEVEVNLDYTSDTILAIFDKNHLSQIIINIILNSNDALKNLDKPKINILIKEEHNYILLVISDNGMGMSKDTQRKAFEPFYTTKETGTGLGLFVVKKLVEENNATIDLVNKQGEGLKVIIKMEKVIEDEQNFSYR